jgi:hypothetical protein
MFVSFLSLSLSLSVPLTTTRAILSELRDDGGSVLVGLGRTTEITGDGLEDVS